MKAKKCKSEPVSKMTPPKSLILTLSAIIFLSPEISADFTQLLTERVGLTDFNFEPEIVEFLNTTLEAPDETECRRDLMAIVTGARNMEIWALKMFDSSSKIPPGIISGNIFLWGHYDECLDIRESIDGRLIEGQYCHAITTASNFSPFGNNIDIDEIQTLSELASNLKIPEIKDIYEIPNYVKMAFSMCVPKTCSGKNLRRISSYLEEKINSSTNTLFHDSLCDYRGKPQNPLAIDFYVFCFFGAVAALILFSTISDYRAKNSGSEFIRIFSLRANFKKLVSTSASQQELSCLNGIRVLTTVWVIYGHSMLTSMMILNINTFYVLTEYMRDIRNSVSIGAYPAVETFFTVGGLLLMYVTLPKLKNIRLLSFYTARLVRLLPALGATILLYISVLKHLGDGPLWPFVVSKTSASCYKSGLLTFAQLTSFPEDMCLEQTWYNALDSQLYIIAPLMLFNIKKHPRRTLFCMICAIIFSMGFTFFRSVQLQMEKGEFANLDRRHFKIYSSVFTRAPAWFIGMILGYYLRENKNRKVTIPVIVNLALTSVSLVIMAGIVASHAVINRNLNNWYTLGLQNAICRPLWSICLCWIVYSCAYTKNSLVNKILSLKIFEVFSRLTYSMYLIQLLVFYVFMLQIRSPGHFSNLKGFHTFLGDLTLTTAASVVLYLVFEAPIIAAKELFAERRLRNVTDKNNINNNVKEADKQSSVHTHQE